MDTTRTALWHPRQPAFFTVERLSRGISPSPTGHQGKSVGSAELLCLILPSSPRTTRILRSLLNCARPLSSPRCHQRLTCFASRQSRAFQHLSLPAHSLVMHVAAPHHSLTRSRKPSLDGLRRPWVSLVEHDGDKLARSLRLLVTSSHWLWRSDTASPCFLCIGKRDVMQLFPNGSVQSLDLKTR